MSVLALVNARLLDPASDYDGPGALLIENGRIVEVIRGTTAPLSSGAEVIDVDGLCLAPGLIDIRVKTGEPGAEPKETLKSASLSAAAGGVGDRAPMAAISATQVLPIWLTSGRESPA